MKYPWLKFFPGDYFRDPGVRSVCLAARGLWMDMLCLMHQSPKSGYLQHPSGLPISPIQLARMVGGFPDEIASLLQELADSGVYSRGEDGVIYCRRMAKDAAKREKCSKAGQSGGGNPNLKKMDGPLKDTFKGDSKGEDKGDFALNNQKSEVRSQKSEKDISEAKASSSAPSAAGVKKFSPSAIDELYQAYPRKKQPVDARKAIVKALGIIAKRGVEEPVEWLKGRVQAYALTSAGEDQQFTPYPATWFNRGGYDEDLSTRIPSHANGYRSAEPDTTPLAVDAALWRAFITSSDFPEYRSLADRPTPKTEADISPGALPDWKRFKHTAKQAGGVRYVVDAADFARWLRQTYPRADQQITPRTADFSIVQEYLNQRPVVC